MWQVDWNGDHKTNISFYFPKLIVSCSIRASLPLPLQNGPFKGMVTSITMMVSCTILVNYLKDLIGSPQVSVVDGYNLPMRIDNNKGCRVASCPVDLNPKCKRRPILLTCKRLCWYYYDIRSCQVERTNWFLWTYFGLQECMPSEPWRQPRLVQLNVYKNN